MKPFMSKYDSPCCTLMRIVAGFLFTWHGAQKLFGSSTSTLPPKPGSHHRKWPVSAKVTSTNTFPSACSVNCLSSDISGVVQY